MRQDMPASPCISLCQLDDKRICRGCHRSATEITYWSTYDREERLAVLERCRQRAQAADTGESSS